MTRDCQDEDTEPGSIADLRAEFAAAVEEFRGRAREDIEKRADAKPVAERTDAEPEPDEDLQGGGLVSAQPILETEGPPEGKQQPFNPEPVLFVPHGGNGVGRPIPRRPDATPPVRSTSLRVTDGEDAVERALPGERYEVEARVWNIGGSPARSASVELFAEHATASVTLDRQAGTEDGPVRLRPDPADGAQVPLTGYTSYRPPRTLYFISYTGDSSGGVTRDQIIDFWVVELAPGRLFEIPDHNGKEFLYLDDAPESDDFTIMVLQVPGADGEFGQVRNASAARQLLDGLGARMNSDTGQNVSDTLVAEIDATFDTNAAVKEQTPLPLANSLRDDLSGRIGKRQLSLPQNDGRTVSFDYEPTAAPNEAELVRSTFHVRLSSLATNEVPADWGRLAHTESRFVGRTEVGRTE